MRYHAPDFDHPNGHYTPEAGDDADEAFERWREENPDEWDRMLGRTVTNEHGVAVWPE